jgi:hypothetical protein
MLAGNPGLTVNAILSSLNGGLNRFSLIFESFVNIRPKKAVSHQVSVNISKIGQTEMA